MNDQEMEMLIAYPDWQPETSRQGSSSSRQTDQSGSADTSSSDKAGAYGDYSQGYRAAPSHTPHNDQHASSQSRSQKGWPLFGFFTRSALVAIWAATPLVNRAFHGGWILPLLGVVFLPFTTLTYTVVFALAGGVTGLNWLWVVGAVLLDLASYGTQVSKRKSRSQRDVN